MSNYISGYDLSTIQGIITPTNWQQIASSGISFIINRCGVGNNGIDNLYNTNIANAKKVGIYTLAYHFVFPLPTTAQQPLRDPILQAEYHFRAANGVRAVMDFEYPTQDQWSKWGCSATQINAWGLAYLQRYSQLQGSPCICYTFPWFCSTVKPSPEYAQYPLWIASYDTTTPTIPSPWNDWQIWQYAGGTAGHLPSGAPVDTNYAKDLSLFGVQPQQPNQSIPSFPSAPTNAPMGGSMSDPQAPPQMPNAAPQMPQGTVSAGEQLSEPVQTITPPTQVPNQGTISESIVQGIRNIFKF